MNYNCKRRLMFWKCFQTYLTMKLIFQGEGLHRVLFEKHGHNLTPIRSGRIFPLLEVESSAILPLHRRGKRGEVKRGKVMDCKKHSKSELGWARIQPYLAPRTFTAFSLDLQGSESRCFSLTLFTCILSHRNLEQEGSSLGVAWGTGWLLMGALGLLWRTWERLGHPQD